MPDGLGPLIANTAVAVGSAAGNWAATGKQNRKSREFSREMYARTYADNLKLWNLTNEYNSPSNQMKRFQEAGLNPNLIYGQAGDNSASTIPTPDVVPAQFRTPDKLNLDVIAPLLAQADLRIKNAQYDNLVSTGEVIRQDAALKGIENERSRFDLEFLKENRGTNIDFLKEGVRQRRIGTDLMINRDAREAIQTSSNVSEAAARIANMMEQNKSFALERDQTRAETARIYENIRQMQKDGRLKDFEIKLNESNVSKSDPLYMRWIADFLSGKSTAIDKIKDTVRPMNENPGWYRFFGGH